MGKRLIQQTNFNGGEITPLMRGRNDLQVYNTSVDTLTNMIPLIQGPVKRRNGSQYIAEVKDSTDATYLIPFRSVANGNFILEFGDQYIRFYQNKAQIQSGGVPYEIASPYSSSQLANLKYVQYGDLLYLVHPSVYPKTLTHVGTVSWSLDNTTLFPIPTTEIGEFPATDITLSATSGVGITITASAAAFLNSDIGRQVINLNGVGRASITGFTSTTVVTADVVETFDSTTYASNEYKIDASPIETLVLPSSAPVRGQVITMTTGVATFRSTDVGRYIITNDGIIEITTYTSGTSIKGEVLKTLSAGGNTDIWTLEDPTWSSSRGYPKAIGFHQQRLWYGGTTSQPSTIWGSETGIYDGFGIGSEDDASISIDLASDVQSQVQWIGTSPEGLLIGTTGAVYNVQTSGGGPITPSNREFVVSTYIGSKASSKTAVVGSELLYVDSSGLGLQSLGYSLEDDKLKPIDLMLRAKHLTSSGINDIVYTLQPNPQLHLINGEGDLLIGLYSRTEQVLGWSKHTTQGTYESIASIPTSTGDQVWCVVKRTINSTEVRYIEVFDDGDGTSNLDGFSDSFITYSGSATSSITGLDHLEGETVQVKVDGAAHPDCIVSSGSIALTADAEEVVVGLSFTSTLQTLPTNYEFGIGPMQAQRTRHIKPYVRLYKSTLPTINGTTIPSRSTEDLMDTAVPLFTGDAQYGPLGWSKTGELTITTSDPFPLVILALYMSIDGGTP